MPQVEATVSCPVFDSFRVQQVAGLFDVPLADRATANFAAEVPNLTEPWQIGLIVGPSGSGKTTIARAAFGDGLYDIPAWPRDRTVVDAFGKLPMRSIVGLLTAVGFGSPPAWIKPYHVLSGGERFRCDLARALVYRPGVCRCARASDSSQNTAVPGNTSRRVRRVYQRGRSSGGAQKSGQLKKRSPRPCEADSQVCGSWP